MKEPKIVAVSVGLCSKYGDDFKCFSDAVMHLKERCGKNNIKIDEVVLDSSLQKYMDPNRSRRIDRVSKMGIVASQQCIRNSGIKIHGMENEIGVVVCTTFGAVASSKDFMLSAIEKGEKSASPLIFPYTVPNAATGTLTIEAGLRGFNTTISGSNPICYAYDLLKLNRAKAFLAGGIEELALSDGTGHEDDALLKTPYPIGEGAAMVLLTTAEFANEQNLNPLFEVCSISTSYSSSDASKDIANFDEAKAVAVKASMEDAIKRAGVSKDDISFIASLSFSDDSRSISERNAASEVWGDHIPEIIYPKDVLGETFGVSDTFNLLSGYARFESLKKTYILSNSHQIGGNISTTVFKVL